jgi:hypothetical protein
VSARECDHPALSGRVESIDVGGVGGARSQQQGDPSGFRRGLLKFAKNLSLRLPGE